MSKTNTTTRRRLARAGLAAGAAGTLLTALTATPAFAVAGTLSLSSTGGPTGGGNTVVATLDTLPTTPNPTSFGSTTAVYFVVASGATATPVCPATYPATPPASGVVATGNPAVKVLSPSKIAVTVPTGVVTTGSGATLVYKYAMCAFASNTSGASLIAGGQYTVGAKPAIDSASGISPLSGPAIGGTTITVKGSNFVGNTTASPNNTTATIDGQPLTNIVVAGDGNSFSAKTPPHAAGGPFILSVTTPAGTVNTLGSGTTKANLFSYTNGIVVSPNTAPNSNGAVDLDVLGVGFANYSFDSTTGANPNTANAHVYLSAGAHDPTGSTSKAVAEKTECINVLVIADTELLCSLPLNHTYTNANPPALDLTGTGTARTGKNVTTVDTSPAITSTNAIFTQADVGLPISGTGVPANAVIASVSSATQATLSANANASGTAADLSVGGPKALSSVTPNATGTQLTATGAYQFSQADVGRVVTSTALTPGANPGLPANTTITAVNAAGTVATLSTPITGTVPSSAQTDFSVTQSVPVSNGTYTISVVSTGAIGASPTQSIISSGATFTVAPY